MPNTNEDTIEALRSELDAAIDLMTRVASGKQTIKEMGEWVSLNFPKFRDELPESMRVTPRDATGG